MKLRPTTHPHKDETLTRYVLGLIFSFDYESILLIEKRRPHWQAGKLNGIGGKIEPGESPAHAMMRECLEETGLHIPIERWRDLGTKKGDGYELSLFVSTADIVDAEAMTDEELVILNPYDPILAERSVNLRSLIDAALDSQHRYPTLTETFD